MRGAYIRVGAFAVLAAGLLLGAALFLSSNKIAHGQTYETYFRDSVQGLDPGAAVKYRGVAVGQVTMIGLVNAEYGAPSSQLGADPAFRLVLVRFAIDTARIGAVPDADTLVREGLRARIAPQGLTGQSYVDLDFMDPVRFPGMALPWTPRAPYIPSVQSVLSQVTDAGTVLLAKVAKIDLNGLADGLQSLIADLRATLHGGDVRTLMTEGADTMRLLRAGLAAADVPGTAAALRQTLAAVQELAQGRQTRNLLASATEAAGRLTQATARLPQLLATLQDVARRAESGSADAEASLGPLLRDARATLAALRQTSEALRQDPGQVVLQGPPPRSLPP